MIRRHLMALRVALMLGDGLSAVLVFLAVSFLRFRDGDPTALWRQLGIDIRLAALLFGLTWVLTLWSMGLYRLSVRWRLWTEARDIARTTLVVLALTLSTLFIFKQEDVSRLFLAFLFVAQPAEECIRRAETVYREFPADSSENSMRLCRCSRHFLEKKLHESTSASMHQ